jgi:hypothetical protein
MKNYLTMSLLSMTEGFASQMGNFAALYAIAQKTEHRIVFLDTWTEGKGLMLNIPFESPPLEILSEAALTAQEREVAVVELDTKAAIDSRVFELQPNVNYDIRGFFMSYRYWYAMKDEVFAIFKFKAEIVAQAAAMVSAIGGAGKEVVAVHVRRNDYLNSQIHANLSYDYYASAFAQFRGDKYAFLVFSDDIEWCKQAFGRRQNVHYSTQTSHYVDMCAMTLCHHNILANSSFSMWGALLNPNQAKKVVCPAKFLKDGTMFGYVNHVWFPDDWIPLDDLMA